MQIEWLVTAEELVLPRQLVPDEAVAAMLR